MRLGNKIDNRVSVDSDRRKGSFSQAVFIKPVCGELQYGKVKMDHFDLIFHIQGKVIQLYSHRLPPLLLNQQRVDFIIMPNDHATDIGPEALRSGMIPEFQCNGMRIQIHLLLQIRLADFTHIMVQ